MLEQDVAYRAPEVPPVGDEGMLEIGFDILFLRRLDFLQGFGRLFFVIERGQQARLYARAQFPHFRRVQAEIMTAQRPYAHEFHLSLEEIDEHGQFVDPSVAEPAAPEIHPVVVRELTALLQAFMFQHVGLQVLGIRIHGPKFVNADHFPVITHPAQLDEGTAGRVVVPDGGFDLPAQDKELPFMEALVDDFETGPVHPAQQFHPAVGAVLSLRDPHVEPAGPLEFRTHPVPQVMPPIDHLSHESRIGLEDDVLLEPGSPGVTPEISIVDKGLIGLVQEGIQMTYLIEGHLVDDKFRLMPLQGGENISVIRIHDVSPFIELAPVLFDPGIDLIHRLPAGGRMDPVDIHMGHHVVFQFGTCLLPPFGIVRGDVLVLMPEGNPGPAPFDELHRR